MNEVCKRLFELRNMCLKMELCRVFVLSVKIGDFKHVFVLQVWSTFLPVGLTLESKKHAALVQSHCRITAQLF